MTKNLTSVAILVLALAVCAILAISACVAPPPEDAADALREHCSAIRDPRARLACQAAVDAAEGYCTQPAQ